MAQEVHSAVPATKAAILSLATSAAPSGVRVSFADEGENTRSERIWLGPTTIGDDTPVSIKSGRRRLQEEFTVILMVEVSSKRTPQASEERVFEIAALLEDAIALDHTLSNVENLLWCLVDGKELETGQTSEGPFSVLEIRLSCVAQLGRS